MYGIRFLVLLIIKFVIKKKIICDVCIIIGIFKIRWLVNFIVRGIELILINFTYVIFLERFEFLLEIIFIFRI